MWEWIGPTDGLLVYLSSIKESPNYKSVFGTGTFGKNWKHGFEPLASLDANSDGVLNGSELAAIGIWVDGNSDAIAQEGEVKPAKDHNISSISVAFVEDKDGNVWNSQGAKQGSNSLTVWDWISYGYPVLDDSTEMVRFDWTNKVPPKEFFNLEIGEGIEKLTMPPGGVLRVYKVQGKLYVRATAAASSSAEKDIDIVYPAEVTADGVLQWGMRGLTNSLLPSGSEFYGLTIADKMCATWSAKLVSGSLDELRQQRL